MKKMANDIQAVINTLSGIEIKATPNNIERLYGCYQVLVSTAKDLSIAAAAQEAAMNIQKQEEDKNGATDSE